MSVGDAEAPQPGSAANKTPDDAPPLLCLVGPTAAGKTGAALVLAQAFEGTVINADSRQVYADFPIITAQPSAAERAVCPHLLYGFLACHERVSAGRFTAMAREAIATCHAQGRLPMLVGGTGLYVRSLLEGLAPIPAIPSEIGRRLAEACAARGLEALRQELARLDPESAARLHPNDRQRILRALEVVEATGQTLSWWHRRPVPRPRYRVLKLGLRLDMAVLGPRLARRIELMLDAGALEEAHQAMAHCPDPTAPGWSGIGCAELLAHLRGELDLAAATALWLKNTRAYAKRQMTWFRKERDLLWLDASEEATPERLLALTHAFLQGEKLPPSVPA